MPDTTASSAATSANTNSTAGSIQIGESPVTGDLTDWKAESDKWKDLARKHEERAKANASASKELETLRQQSMSDQEKAVAQAKAEGMAEGLAAGAAKVVAAEIRAAAAGRMTGEQLQALLEGINLVAFIGTDGEVDEAKVARFVDGIAPAPDEEQRETRQGFPDLGQGARGGMSNAALNGDPLLQDLKAKLGIR